MASRNHSTCVLFQYQHVLGALWVITVVTFSWVGVTKLVLHYGSKNHRYDVYAAKSLQLYPTLCNPIDGSPPGSPVPGILQARTLEWAAISFSNAWKWKVRVKSLSCVRLFVTAAYQAPLSMGFSRQEYWSGLPLPSSMMSILHHKEYLCAWLHSR